jgi:glycosyltransferase involved in cell wall biosynthesis
MKPETSVIIPVRNGARFVAEAIASVLDQLARGDEIVAVDDGSRDETADILARFVPRGLTVLNGDGKGVSAARNFGFAASRGAFVAFLDHDDLWPAGRHAALSGALRADGTLDAAFGRIQRRFEPGAPLTAESRVQDHHASYLVGSGLYRRRLIDRVGGFAEDMPLAEDVDFDQRLGEAGMRAQFCEAYGLIRRHHDGNTTNDNAGAVSWRLQSLRRKLARAKAAADAKPPGD